MASKRKSLVDSKSKSKSEIHCGYVRTASQRESLWTASQRVTVESNSDRVTLESLWTEITVNN